jgi:hypothetical protein
MEIAHGLELLARDRRTRSVGRARNHLRGIDLEHASRREQSAEQIRNGKREQILLRSHRRRVVDHEEQIDLVDRSAHEDRRIARLHGRRNDRGRLATDSDHDQEESE